MVLDMPDMVDMVTLDMLVLDIMARGLLMLSPKPRLLLIPTTMVDMVLDMPDMVDMVLDMPDMVDMVTLDMLVLDIMARGLLMLSLKPRLMLIPTTMVDIMVLDMPDMVDMVLDIPDLDMHTTDTDMATAMDTGDKYFPFFSYSLLHHISKHRKLGYRIRQDLSVIQQLESSIKNGLYQFEFLPSPVLLSFQCYQISFLIMVCRKQENQKVMIR